jgi:hypothetical protein
MAAVEMPRKPKTYKLDERLIAALDDVATRSGESVGSFVEKVLWRYCQGVGAIDHHVEPSKDKRGGKREGAGRKPSKKSDDEEAIEP